VSPRTINRLKLIGIGAIAVAPVLGSYLLYWFWSPGGYTNYGTLLEPRPVSEITLSSTDGTAFSFRQLRGRWVLVTVDSGRCSAQCEKKLWTMRQVRQAQGKDVPRIERVLIIDDDGKPAEQVIHDYAGTWFVRAKESAMPASFVAEGSNRDHIYLVDPRGNVMLRFPEAPDPKRMIKDISRLLRYSRIG